MRKSLIMVIIILGFLVPLTGCEGMIPNDNNGDSEQVVDEKEIVVDIEGSITIKGKDYVSAGVHDITVTFPQPDRKSVV